MSQTVKLPAPVMFAPGEIVGIGLHNAGAGTLGAGVATFGQAFQPGHVPAGQTLMARIGGQDVPVQMDVKTRHADGSVKFAVVSVARPELAPGAVAEVALRAVAAGPAAPAIDLGAALAGRSFEVDILPAAGAPIQVDVIAALRAGLADGTASFWQQGALASQARVEVDLPGSQRLVFDVTAFADGNFAVHAQFNNDQAMQAVGGRATYTAVVRMDGAEVLRQSVSQAQYQNWRESFSSSAVHGSQGLGDPSQGWLNLRHDVAYLQGTGAISRYDLEMGISSALIEAWAQQAATTPNWGAPLANNGILQNMGAPGARDDIGVATAANSAWLMSQDPRVASYALAQAEVSGAAPWNFWDAANGTWLNTDNYPRLWTDPRGGTGRPGDPTSMGLTQQAEGREGTGWALQRSHQPDLSFVPYVLTGERIHLDAVQAQASYSLMALWPFLRQDSQNLLVGNGDQVRASAWSLRQIENALWASPEGSPERDFLQRVSDQNWAWLVSQIPAWTEMQGEVHGWLPIARDNGGTITIWQNDYLAFTSILAASRGNADALTFLEWQSNFLIGRFLNAENGFNPRDGVAFSIVLGPPNAPNAPPFRTWAEIGAEMRARGYTNGTEGWPLSDGEYGRLGMATLAGIYHLTGNPDALRAYKIIAAENPPFTAEQFFAQRPNYAITIPGIYGGTIAGTDGDDVVAPIGGTLFLRADLGEGFDTLTLGGTRNEGFVRNVEVLNGSPGNDVITLASAPGGTLVDLRGGNDTLRLADVASNRVTVLNTETIIGGTAMTT